jgi:hypothetical protein
MNDASMSGGLKISKNWIFHEILSQPDDCDWITHKSD